MFNWAKKRQPGSNVCRDAGCSAQVSALFALGQCGWSLGTVPALLALVCGCWGLGRGNSITGWQPQPGFPFLSLSLAKFQKQIVKPLLGSGGARQVNHLQTAPENLKNAHECAGQGFVGQLVCFGVTLEILKGLQQDTEPSSGWTLPQLPTATSLWVNSSCTPRAECWQGWGWQLVRCCDTCPSPVENTVRQCPGVTKPSCRSQCWCPSLMVCWSVMMIFWQSLMGEIELQFKAQREGSRNLSLLILLSVLILGTLPHSTLVGESCQKWWCHHHQAHLTLAADCQCWVQVNKSPGTWIHSGVLLQCSHSVIPR